MPGVTYPHRKERPHPAQPGYGATTMPSGSFCTFCGAMVMDLDLHDAWHVKHGDYEP